MTGDKQKQKQKGFALLYAVVVIGAVTIATYSMSNIILKQFKFAKIMNESQQALFVANSGMECALYWDSKEAKFPAYDGDIKNPFFRCGSIDFSPVATGSADHYVTDFTFQEVLNTYCAVVSVDKQVVSGEIVTKITSLGRSKCNDPSVRGVERAVGAAY